MTIPRTLVALIIGQSYGRAGYDVQAAWWAFCTAIRRVIDSDTSTINSNTGLSLSAGDCLLARNRAADGSAVLERNDGGAGYWVGDDLASAGPLLSSAISAIGGYSPKPLITIDSHGEQDAGLMSGASEAADWKTAKLYMLTEIRTAINSGNPTGMPVWMDILGPRFPAHEIGEYLVRDKMIEIVDENTRIYRGAEKYALQLDGTTHPVAGSDGYAQMGAHTGRKVASWLVDTSQSPSGPSIINPQRNGRDVSVTISVPAGQTLVKPANPEWFGLFDGSENRIPISNFSWSDNVLTMTAAPSPAPIPAKLRYPCRPIPTSPINVDITKIIRLSNPVDPIYPGEPGFVLESMKTHTF